MENKIAIKIKSCPNPGYWYAKFIGNRFIVSSKTGMYNGKEVYIVDTSHLSSAPSDTGYIAVEDTRIIPMDKIKKNSQKKERE